MCLDMDVLMSWKEESADVVYVFPDCSSSIFESRLILNHRKCKKDKNRTPWVIR